MIYSPKHQIPQIINYLLERHAKEWNAASYGSITYHLRRGQGCFIILRTPKLRAKRLISAHIPIKLPKSKKAWKALKDQLEEENLNSITDAKHRYLFISDKIIRIAEKSMVRTKVKIVSLPLQ